MDFLNFPQGVYFITVAPFFQLTDLIGNIQVQRGYTAMYLSSNKTNRDAGQKLTAAHGKTSVSIVSLSNWFELHIIQNVFLKTKDDLLNYIQKFNTDVFVVKEPMSLREAIKFYTDIDLALLDQMASRISVPEHDRLLVALYALLRASDAVGIQRALGAAYWSNCQFPQGDVLWFTSLQSEDKTYLDQLFRYHQESMQTYETGLRALDPLESLLISVSADMSSPSYQDICKEMPLDERYHRSFMWFENVTDYMRHLGTVKVSLVNVLLEALDETMSKAQTEVSV